MNRKALLMLLVLAAAAATVTAQEDGETATEVFTDSVAVRVVNVDVFVTDKKGRAIQGLTAEDFELYEDGRRVEITNFFAADEAEEEDSSNREAAATATSPASPPEATSELRPAAPRIPLVVLVDNLNLRPGGRKRVLADLREALEGSIASTTPVMIAVHGRQGLQPLLAPTTDRAAILRALDEAESMTAEGVRLDAERRSVLRMIEDIFTKYQGVPGGRPCVLGREEFVLTAETHARNQLARNEATANGLSILVGALSGWPGLKSLVYVGDGLPQFGAIEIFNYLGDLCPEVAHYFQQDVNRFDSSRIFDRLTQRANSNRVTIHTLEARGLTTSSIDSVEAEGARFGRRFTPSPLNDRIRTANLQSSLFQIATDTGGRAVLNANSFDQEFLEIDADSRNYYSLGFQARQRGDGRVHRLRLELTKNDHQLRYRKTYRDKPVEETLVERTLGALIFDLEENPLAATVEVRQVPTETGASEVRLLVSIPRAQLTLLPAENRRQGQLRLVLTARDADNKLQPIKQQLVPVVAEGAGPDAAGAMAELEIGIELEPGDHELALAIRDEVTATTSFLRRAVRVEG